MTSTNSNPGPVYRILTPRLLIRCPEPADAPALDLAIQQNLDHLRPWVLWARHEPASFEERINFLRRTRGNFDLDTDYGYLIFIRQENQLIGGTGLSKRLGPDVREIGYWIHKDHINRGYATEVSAALTKVAFEVDHVRRVEIHCGPQNVRSASIPRKLGFIHEATLHNRVEEMSGSLRDTMIWSLFEENYPSSRAAQTPIQAFDAVGRQIL
jgi:RimJ/RimL family protein N-acetyltransferase